MQDRAANTCPRCRGYKDNKTNLCGKVRPFTGVGVMKYDKKVACYNEAKNIVYLSLCLHLSGFYIQRQSLYPSVRVVMRRLINSRFSRH